MSYLRRHAKPGGKALTEKYHTRLTKEVADQFNKWCHQFNLSPSEAIRLLIEEEVKGLETRSNDEGGTVSSLTSASVDESRPTSTRERPQVGRPRKARRSAPAGIRFTYAPWEVGGKLPCTKCNGWYQSSTFSGRHAKDHGFISTKDYFAKNIEKINQMYKDLTGNDPVYDPNMLK